VVYAVEGDPTRRPFDPDRVAKHAYDIWHLQDEVYVIDSFPSLGKLFRDWARKYGLIEADAA